MVEVRITETEAYGGLDDPASHAARGRTPRNQPMFGLAGTVYIYRIYGMHWCANIVTGDLGDPQAVLMRGGVVTKGNEVAVRRRGRTVGLADGPGKLTQALGITDAFNNSSVNVPGSFSLEPGKEPSEIQQTPRIGISKAVDRLWRFCYA
jgi:DNA-3-methyladenine glycosylase